MAYIQDVKLSAEGDLEHKNPSHHVQTQLKREDGGSHLPYFSTLTSSNTTIRLLLDMYYVDMQLFGYELVLENGEYYATCESYKKFGSCW